MKKKLSSRRGETILETLVALLIITLSITYLSTSIAKSSSILHDIRDVSEDGFAYSDGEGASRTISAQEGIMTERTVTVFEVPQYEGAAENYYYYKP